MLWRQKPFSESAHTMYRKLFYNLKSFINDLSPLVKGILLCTFILRIGTTMTIPFISIFLHYKVGISLYACGLIISMSHIAFVFGGFLGAALSKTLGRNFIVKIAFLCYSLIFISLGVLSYLTLSLNLSLTAIAWIFGILNLLAGLFRIWLEALTQAIISDITNVEKKHPVFNFRYTLGNIGSAIGPLLGAFCGFSGNASGFFTTGALLLICYIAFTISSKKCLMVDHGSEYKHGLLESLNILFKDKSLKYYTFGSVLLYIILVQYEFAVSQVLFERFGSSFVLSMMLGTKAVTIIFLQIPITSYFLRKYSPAYLMQVGCIFIAVGLIGISFAEKHYLLYLFSQVIVSIGEIMTISVGSIYLDSISPANLRSMYFGSIGLQYLGKALGPTVGALLLTTFSSALALCAFAAIALFAMVFYSYCSKLGVTSSHRLKA